VTPFQKRVAAVVRAIPKGRVLGYAQVALRAGRPGAARGVVRALNDAHKEGLRLPWWRVVRSDRTLAPLVAAEQSRRLKREGVQLRVSGRKRR
jgi:methylated-DNA-protein-cysteine methyltransferase-like protein